MGLSCEDIMLWLVFRHLIPLAHSWLTPQAAVLDLHGLAAEKFLSLVPICCSLASPPPEEPTTTSTASQLGTIPTSNAISAPSLGARPPSPVGGLQFQLPMFLVGLGPRPQAAPTHGHPTQSRKRGAVDYCSYLMDARASVRHRYEATRCWQYAYDGSNPPSNSLEPPFEVQGQHGGPGAFQLGRDVPPGGRPPLETVASGPLSLSLTGSTPNLTEEENADFWSLMNDHQEGLAHDIQESAYDADLVSYASPAMSNVDVEIAEDALLLQEAVMAEDWLEANVELHIEGSHVSLGKAFFVPRERLSGNV